VEESLELVRPGCAHAGVADGGAGHLLAAAGNGTGRGGPEMRRWAIERIEEGDGQSGIWISCPPNADGGSHLDRCGIRPVHRAIQPCHVGSANRACVPIIGSIERE
jgi:hypothetical protein